MGLSHVTSNAALKSAARAAVYSSSLRVLGLVGPNPLPPKSRTYACEQLEQRVVLSASLNSLGTFNGTNGSNPQSVLSFDSAGDLFGTAEAGGAYNDGMVFEIAAGSATITPLATFNGTNGATDFAGVTPDSSGDLFGAADGGGAYGDGDVYEVVHGSGTVTPLANFTDGSAPGGTGLYPYGHLVADNSGNLFGTTYEGGNNGEYGTVFELAHNSTTITNIVSFNGSDGKLLPSGLVIDSNGDVFGTTAEGGTNDYGTVFEITAGTKALTTLAAFNGADGSNPNGSLAIDGAGDLFGTTYVYKGGGGGYGTVFEVAPGTNAITTLASFGGTNGANPAGSLALDGKGDLFGTTANGGNSGYGTVFEIAKNSSTITPLLSFNSSNGANPNGGVIFDSNGDLIGTTSNGGGSNEGTVFEINSVILPAAKLAFTQQPTGGVGLNAAVSVEDSTGALVFGGSSTVTLTLSSGTFSTGSNTATALTVNGVAIFNNLAVASPGNYNLTAADGPLTPATSNSFGIDKLTQDASFSAATGSHPNGGVTFDSSGNLFGTTSGGGSASDGTVFEVASGSAAATTIASFTGANGSSPYDSVTFDSSGNLFGTTYTGGANNAGNVFEIPKGSTTITPLASFNSNTGANNSATGANPIGGVTFDSSGDIFGTAQNDGVYADGTVFEIPNGSTTITAVASFTDAEGAGPHAGVSLDSNGDIFGSVQQKGADGDGTVFEIPKGSTAVTILASFSGLNGISPNGGVTIDSNGNLFGTTYAGGLNGDGSVFELPAGSTSVTTVASFNSTNGAGPEPSVTLDGNCDLFGTTYNGGATGYGTVFEIAKSSSTITSLLSFNSSNGANPYGGVIFDSNGDLIGTTSNGGGSNAGTVFEINSVILPAAKLAFTQQPTGGIGISATLSVEDSTGALVSGGSSTVTLTLSSGTFSTGSNTATAVAVNGAATFNLAITSGGNYTVTASDGSLTVATSNSFSIVSSVVTSLNNTSGTNSRSTLVFDTSGNLFGTAINGGANNDGTVFEIASGSTAVTTLASFNGTNGINPEAGLALDSSADMFGTTYSGGANNDGTAFEIAKGSGAITTLASFNSTNGANPFAGVTLDSSGDLFGTTYNGGANSDGTVFEIPHGSTTITTLGSFNSTNGANPVGGVTLDSSGDLFGTTDYGGANAYGTLFEIPAAASSITTIFSFNSNGFGIYPTGALTINSSGDVFGTTYEGGAAGDGELFEDLPSSSTLSRLASFDLTNGANPIAGLTVDGNGDLFGTTLYGGASGYGTVFELANGSNTLSTIAGFNPSTGDNPKSGVIFDSSGNLYGTTLYGGSTGYGTIYEINSVVLPAAKLAFTQQPTGGIGISATLSVEDSTGALVSGGSSTVTLTLSSGTFSTGSNTASAVTVNGVATFNNLAITSGGKYTLTASDGSLTPATSSSVGIDSIDNIASIPEYPIGYQPNATPVLDSLGDVFGTTSAGGSANDGTVWEIRAGTTTLITLASFNGVNGETPNGVSLDSSGDLFGTTASGSTTATIYGTVFEIAHGSTTITTLVDFNQFTAGSSPNSAITFDTNGDMFGTTQYGTSNGGNVFEILSGTTTITSLANFTFATGYAWHPVGGVILDAAGDIFGAAQYGGANSDGAIFEIAKASGTVTTLASFNGTNGIGPEGLTFDLNGNFLGLTGGGGSSAYGTVFEIPKGSTTLTQVASLNGTDGAYPLAGLTVDTLGDLFGTASYGGATGYGVVFEIGNGSSAVTTIASFGNTNGGKPGSGLALDSNGDIFGTTLGGLNGGYGNIFEISHSSSTITSLSSFAPTAGLYSGLTLDSSGDLFGTTEEGGSNGQGSVFKIAAGSTVISTIASFTGGNGEYPISGVTINSNGNLFGTTVGGGALNAGTVFEIAHDTSTITTIASFNEYNGEFPYAGVTLDSNGNLFGTTYEGSTIGYGTVYEVASGSGTITALADFNNTNGANPYGGITLDSTGDVFGTAYAGGANGYGNAFEIAAGTATITALSNFNSSNGAYPIAGLTRDSKGDLFGTTKKGGTGNYGTVFEIASGTTTITDLASFTSSNGANPEAAPAIDSSGDIFGTALNGGLSGDGTVFELPAGDATIADLVNFSGTNGANPIAGLTFDSNGDLFGTTSGGATYGNGGTVFEVSPTTNGIAFTEPPASTTGGAAFTTQVALQYPWGNTFSTSAAVTLTLNGGTFANGSSSVITSASAGYATFSNLVINTPGTYTLTASSPAATSITSSIFTISVGVGTKVGFIQQPNSATAGNSLPTIAVAIEDPGNNTIATASSTITLTLSSGVFSSGTNTVSAVAINGIATFPGITIDTSGTYTLTASDSSLAAAMSTGFTVVPNIPMQLVFAQAPADGLAGSTLTPPVVVDVEDAFGNIVTSAPSTVTLTLSTGEFTSGSSSAATTTVNGAATFAKLGISSGGTFTLTAADGTLTSATSAPFPIFDYYAGVLASFNPTPGGAAPQSIVTDPSGDLFGTSGGGTNDDGTVFEIATGTGTITTLVSFNSANGMGPTGLALDSRGNLFGTTAAGGANNDGTVFEIPTGTNTLTTLVSFSMSGSDPGSLIIDSSGNVFGTTLAGGANGDGIIFELRAGSSAISTEASFSYTQVFGRATLALDSNGSLFGTTTFGGTYNHGTVFEVVQGTGTITTLASIGDGLDPVGLVVSTVSGNIFGTSNTGGPNNYGAIFELPHGSHYATTLVTFNQSYTQGRNPNGAIILDSSGDLIGTTLSGGANFDGTVFEMAAGTSAITSLASFNGINGSEPYGLCIDSSGDFYGTTQSGGMSGYGTVFELAHGATSISTVASFVGSGGGDPVNVVLDSVGDLFGTATRGGTHGDGTVYEIPEGSSTVTTIANFNSTSGAGPAELVIDPVGDIFGTTSNGTVFEIGNGSNTITTLSSFVGSPTSLVLDAAGDIFGTTSNGGANNDGTVFEIAHGTSTSTAVASFNSVNGWFPNSLVIDSAGDMFGTTEEGGPSSFGTFFEIAEGTSTITMLANFNSINGASPVGVVMDSNGDVFGTTAGGGANGNGTIFEIANGSSAITTLASFGPPYTTGFESYDAYPRSLIIDSRGNLFGATDGNPATGGSIFVLLHGTNTIATLFSVANPNVNFNDLIMDSAGDLIGTTFPGGSANAGEVVELTPTKELAFVDAPASAGVGSPIGGTNGITVAVEGAYGTTAVTDNSPITLTLSGGTFSTGANTLSSNAVDGIAVFQNLSINTPGTYTITATDGSYGAATTTITIAQMPGILTAQVGDGTAQRSSIRSLTVAFNTAVNFNANSYTLYQEPTNPDGSINLSGTPTAIGGLGSTTSGITATSSDGITWTLAVIPGGSLDRTTSAAEGNTNAGILENGIYQLVLHGSAITDAATGTASFHAGADQIVQFYSAEANSQTGGLSNYFHAMYGDTNGDGSVDLTDYRAFKNAYGTSTGDPAFSLGLDSNGDGNIDLTDYRAFKSAYGQSYSY